MKKTKLFSRIFAAALAAMIAATTLITNSGAGLRAFAGETPTTPPEPTYKVSIISPDVPADGKTYRYDFYQIFAGEVEDDGGKNVLGNPKWGAALGGADFDKVPDGKTPAGNQEYCGEMVSGTPQWYTDSGIGYYPTSEVMLAALSGTTSYDFCDMNTSGGPGHGVLIKSAYIEYCKILHSYGVPFQFKSSGSSVDDLMKGENNYFFDKFNRGLMKNGKIEYWNKSGKTRDAAGLVELLNAGLTDGTLKTSDLRAFADLLLNGVTVTIDLGNTEVEVTDEKGNTTKTKTPNYHYNFITGDPQATKEVTAGGTFEVTGLAPGYYLVACVGADDKLSSDGYETSMSIKPVSTMLIMVGPANKGEAQIVGKNAYTVPTISLDIYQKPVQLDLGTSQIQTNLVGDFLNSGGYAHDVKDIGTIIEEDNWKNTGSFDYYGSNDRQEAILYRIGIKLPMNFDQYKDSGYFLAVLNQYAHFGVSSASNKEIDRVVNVRPYVYVKHSSDGKYEEIGRCRGNSNDKREDYVSITATVGSAVIETTESLGIKLSGITGNNTYDQNKDLGFYANDMFCLGNLYDYKTGEGDDEKCVFNPGDTIYIYYPAILSSTNVYTNEKYLLNANRVWAVYSNNPYAEELDYDATKNSCNHIKNGEVGITPIAEANVNTYGVTLKVDGNDKYASGAKYALYREVTGANGDTTKEYAYIFWDSSHNYGYVKYWISESEIQDTLDKELKKDTPAFKTFEDALFQYKSVGSGTAYLTSAVTGIGTNGIKIKGLAAGEYFLQELTISSKSLLAIKDDTHENIASKHYVLAEKPITFNIGNEYNQSVNGSLGVDGNEKTFIEKLTVDFYQENPERAIETYVYKWPVNLDADKNPVAVVDADGNPVKVADKYEATLVNAATGDYATVNGQIEILVYHKKINLIWLPETGGIGTTIFFIVGGVIVVTATVLIVTRFRVKRERL